MKTFVFIVTLFITVSNGFAQNTVSMQERIDQAMQMVQQPTPEAFLESIATLKGISEEYPDSIAPREYLAIQSMVFALVAPTAPQTEALLSSSKEMLATLEALPQMDKSDLYTMQGMYYMAVIVQNPVENGPRYYMQVTELYDKALKLNPDNALAKQMQSEFYKGMNRYLKG
ncbi:MAG: hypothetical protein J5663_04590 [Bacteroidaceae bacterium]|nr:hypothetical protein [Bacteroidaceae bacterium]